MKRWIGLLLALCLPVTAGAETLAERIGAPESWQGECQSNTGKTRVLVDMTIQVPEVEAVPIWAVEPRIFTPEEIAHVADVFLGKGNWRQVEDNGGLDKVVDHAPRYIMTDGTDDWFQDYYCILVTGDTIEESCVVTGFYSTQDGMGDWHQFNSLNYSQLHPRGKRCGDLDEAARMADEIMCLIAPEMVRESHEEYRLVPNQVDYGDLFHYGRIIGGIPVTVVQEQGAGGAAYDYNPVLPYEKLSVYVNEDGVSYLKWEYPVAIQEQIAGDCELLTFDQIMDIFITICPLKYQPYEAYSTTELSIDRATLGYMCLQEWGKPTSYRLVPVWDFFGTRQYWGDHEVIHNQSYLTINAIDGTIIDRSYGY